MANGDVDVIAKNAQADVPLRKRLEQMAEEDAKYLSGRKRLDGADDANGKPAKTQSPEAPEEEDEKGQDCQEGQEEEKEEEVGPGEAGRTRKAFARCQQDRRGFRPGHARPSGSESEAGR